jgi:hypothetical protein
MDAHYQDKDEDYISSNLELQHALKSQPKIEILSESNDQNIHKKQIRIITNELELFVPLEQHAIHGELIIKKRTSDKSVELKLNFDHGKLIE